MDNIYDEKEADGITIDGISGTTLTCALALVHSALAPFSSDGDSLFGTSP